MRRQTSGVVIRALGIALLLLAFSGSVGATSGTVFSSSIEDSSRIGTSVALDGLATMISASSDSSQSSQVSPQALNSSAIEVDGIVEAAYQFAGRVDLGGTGGTNADAPGNLFRAADAGVCYYAFVVDRTYNDNVYDSSPDTPYLNQDGWFGAHFFNHLVTSDRADFQFTDPDTGADVGFVSVDYLYQLTDGTWGAVTNAGDASGTNLSVLAAASSMAYNLNEVTWPQKNSGRSPDYDFNDSNPPKKYQWHMIYELSIDASEFGLGGTCADIDEAGAHNSPFKEEDSGTVGRLGDEVWHDSDGDGVRDADAGGVPTEAGFENVTVRLFEDATDAGDGSCDPASLTQIRVTQTDPAGFYHFENLAAGNYCVAVDESTLPAGFWSLTTPPEPRFVDLASGEEDLTADFGYQLDPCLPTIDFETDAAGNPLSAGTIIDDE